MFAGYKVYIYTYSYVFIHKYVVSQTIRELNRKSIYTPNAYILLMVNYKIVHACVRSVPIKSNDLSRYNIEYSVEEMIPKPYVWILDDAGHVVIQELPHRFILVLGDIINALNQIDTPPLCLSTEQEQANTGKTLITVTDGAGRELFRKLI
jgi:hypothetical protein